MKTGSQNKDPKLRVEFWNGSDPKVNPGGNTFTTTLPVDPIPPRRPRNRMGFPRVKEFGCGISVHTGSILIGVFSLIGGIIMCAPALINGQDFIDYLENTTESKTFFLDDDQSIQSTVNYKDNRAVFIEDPNKKEILETVSIVIDTIIGLGIYNILISLLLLFGITKEVRGCMIPWLITQGVCCIFSVLLFVFFLFVPAILYELTAAYPLIGVYSYFSQLITTFISAAVALHMFFVVHTHYKNLKEQPQGFTPFENF